MLLFFPSASVFPSLLLWFLVSFFFLLYLTLCLSLFFPLYVFLSASFRFRLSFLVFLFFSLLFLFFSSVFFLGSLLYVFSRLLCPLWFFPFLSCGVAILRYAVTSSPSMIITSIVASRGAKFFQLSTSSDPLPFIASKPQWAASRPPSSHFPIYLTTKPHLLWHGLVSVTVGFWDLGVTALPLSWRSDSIWIWHTILFCVVLLASLWLSLKWWNFNIFIYFIERQSALENLLGMLWNYLFGGWGGNWNRWRERSTFLSTKGKIYPATWFFLHEMTTLLESSSLFSHGSCCFLDLKYSAICFDLYW